MTAGGAGDWPPDATSPGSAGILVIADPYRGSAAEKAVAACGARLLGRVGWAEAAARLDRQGAVAAVLAEAHGADDAVLGQVLPLLDMLTRGGETRIVVALDIAQVDLVAANLAGPRVDLLCMPSVAERVVALCLAGVEQTARVHDVGREAARLRRLNEEVARIAETLARLTRDEERAPQGGAVAERGLTYRAQPPLDDAPPGAPDIAARDIREAIRARRMRDQFFGIGLFEDPAWDMLLDLFAADLERTQVSVSSLCIAAAVAPTTALRWIARMTDAGLFERRPDPFDRRRAFMALSPRAGAGMRDYVAALRRVGLAIP